MAKVPKIVQNGGLKLDVLTFLKVVQNGSGVAQAYPGDAFKVFLSFDF